MSTSHRDAHPYGRSADDVRRRDRRLRRTRRLRATQLAMFSVLAVALIAIGVYAVGELREPATEPGVISPKELGPDPVAVDCPEPDAVPLEPGKVAVTVLNGTTRSGLAGTTAEELGERGYEVGDVGNTSSAGAPVTIVYGPAGYLAAMSLSAQLATSEQEPVLDLAEDREGAGVDLLLGNGYRGLAEADDASAALEEPVPLPEGC
jgi:hypothetical protein